LTGDTNSAVSGRLVSNIADPVKTLFLSNHSDKAIVIEHVSQGAFMFDGEIVDCNAACVGNTLTIPANQEVEVKFERRKQFNQLTKAEDFRRFQSRVTRLHDGTRVIPFTAKVRGKVASIV